MMLAAKQFMSGRDFDERQFAYKQEQDKTENAYRSQSQAREDEKFEKSLAQQDRQFGLQERGMKIKENPVTKEMQNYNALVEQGIDPETAKRVSFKYKPDKSTGQIKDEAKAYWQGRVEGGGGPKQTTTGKDANWAKTQTLAMNKWREAKKSTIRAAFDKARQDKAILKGTSRYDDLISEINAAEVEAIREIDDSTNDLLKQIEATQPIPAAPVKKGTSGGLTPPAGFK